MKDYKRVLLALALLLLLVIIALCSWLWLSNRKNMDPLPVMVSDSTIISATTNEQQGLGTSNDVTTSILYIQAEDKLQAPLDDILARFEARHPSVKVAVRYVPAEQLLLLPTIDVKQSKSSDLPQPLKATIDIIIANSNLDDARLSDLQTLIYDAQAKLNKNQVSIDNVKQEGTTQIDNNEARTLASFNYALKGSQTVDGVILTESPAAISLRNFMLSSVGQDILKTYNYDGIDGYQNTMDEIFNDSTSEVIEDVDVTDILQNSQ
ncbi:hypothetical protein [Psychrobacter sp. DM4]|uniref:hypothetical protein n=1 Tax=Psychrobacter sp. DM4 TaxID=3440637 RepID=UPI003F4F4CF5